jgi:hypothetical protein
MNQPAYRYVNESSISSSLICPICLDVLEEPYTHLICDSAFCQACLLQLAKPVCPICRHYWGDFSPWQANQYLPKTNRLIRNILDELLVECRQCQHVCRRGHFEHQCQPIEQSSSSPRATMFSIFSITVVLLWIVLIYLRRECLFLTAIDRREEMVRDTATNIDQYLFKLALYLIDKLTAYVIPVLIFNLGFWLSIRVYGHRWTSKTTNHRLQKALEISIIISLIIYSIHH